MVAVACPCGATRKDQQIGSEPSPDCLAWARLGKGWQPCDRCYVCRMVGVFRHLRRVLRDDGTCWLNLGDSYASGEIGRHDQKEGRWLTGGNAVKRDGQPRRSNSYAPPLPPGNLVGVPWRLALALQADGWILRQDIIWSKLSPMPESVRNRCTKSHEYVFLLAKGQRYYCDMEAIKEPSPEASGWAKQRQRGVDTWQYNDTDERKAATGQTIEASTFGTANQRNKRSVWRVPSHPYPGAHYATFPPKLTEPMIKAGTSERGCCATCGTPWRRVTEDTPLRRERPNEYVKRSGQAGTGNSCANTVAGVETRTLGWQPGCRCAGLPVTPPEPRPNRKAGEDGEHPAYRARLRAWHATWEANRPAYDATHTVPCVVLDIFVGSGTVPATCIGLGRHGWGIDLSATYLTQNAIPRVGAELAGRPALAWLLPGARPVAVAEGEEVGEGEGDVEER